MKPLQSAPFTEEDKLVWYRMYRLEPFTHLAFAGNYASADRRDADLMLMLAQGGCPICRGQYVHKLHCDWWWTRAMPPQHTA